MSKKDRMGSGLDMLFEDNFHDSEDTGSKDIQTLRISLIEPDKDQPRKIFNEESLKELAENIEQHGVLQPILVRPIENGSYRIVAGERRWRAARLAGLKEIPALIRELDDFQTAQIGLIENLQREDLNPIEEARAYRRLMDEFHMTQEELSRSIGKSRSSIANTVRLLNLREDLQDKLSEGTLSVGQAKVLLGIDDDAFLSALSEKAEEGLSVRELEGAVAIYKANREHEAALDDGPETFKPKIVNYTDPFKKYSKETELSFKELYNVDAKIRKEKNGKFSLKLIFKSDIELEEMVARLSDRS